MRQTTLSSTLGIVRRAPEGEHGSIAALLRVLEVHDDLAFYAVIPHGHQLKCIAELLMRCAPHVPITVDGTGINFVACDPVSGRLIHIRLLAADMLRYQFLQSQPLRCTLESNSLHAVFHQLKRKDQVVLYGTMSGQFGSLVDYSANQHHTKHSTIATHHAAQSPEYLVPKGYQTEGVKVASNILQRILREYKNLSKRIILTGNDRYIHISTDTRVSLHRSDNLFGYLAPRDDDMTVELNISTLGRILKVTQFNHHVRVVCEVGLPVQLYAPIGEHGSAVTVFIQPEMVCHS